MSYSEEQTKVLDEKTYGLFKMFSPLEPMKRHNDIRLTRVKKSGTWLLQLQSFCNWSNDEQTEPVFFCHGEPGTGKTFLSSLVIDDLISRHIKPSTGKVGITYLYADYRDQKAQTVTSILGSFLQQFLFGLSRFDFPQELDKILFGLNTGHKPPSRDNIMELLKTTLKYLDRAFICIDGLDELEVKTRGYLLQEIGHLVDHAKNDRLRVFLTGRKQIEAEVQKLSGNSSFVEIVAHSEDVRLYLEKEFAEDENPESMDETLKNEIFASLVERSQQMFLLPTLHIKMVLELPTKTKRRVALKTLPQGLHETFEAAITRIKELPVERAYLGMQVLMWLHLAIPYRPLQLAELQHALSVETGETEFDPDNIPSLKMILESCLGLVIHDAETGAVRFVHYTIEEYLRSSGEKIFPDGYSTAAEICLTYLTFGNLPRHCETKDELQKRVEDFAFLKYAAMTWGYYLGRIQNCTDTVRQLAFKILEQPGKTSCPSQVLYSILPDTPGPYKLDLSGGKVVSDLSGVHVAAHFGLIEYIQRLCLQSHLAADMKDGTGRTPLSWAAQGGHDGVVKFLLAQADVDVNSKDSLYGQTPLLLAAEGGYEGVVKLLLSRDDVDVNTRSKNDRTPLSSAASGGHEGVVKLLLTRDNVDVTATSNSDKSPLACAARGGYESVVKLLLERKDVDVNTRSNSERIRTPLSFAAGGGHEGVVKLLLARDDVNVTLKDTDQGHTALSWAAKAGHEGVVRLLLERKDVDVNTRSNDGKTPLTLAAIGRHEDVVKLLLARGDVDVNSKDSEHSQTALLRAAQAAYEGVVKLLLGRSDVDVNLKDDEFGRTALLWAAWGGYEGVVKLLLGRNDVDVNLKDSHDGQTALALAAEECHEGVVRLLLARDDVDASIRSDGGRTPLSYAASCEDGHDAVVKLLLERKDVDVNTRCNNGLPPLAYAAGHGNEAVVKLLLARDEVEVNWKGSEYFETVLFAAVEHENVVKLLLARSDVDFNARNKDGKTAEEYAREWGYHAGADLIAAKSATA